MFAIFVIVLVVGGATADLDWKCSDCSLPQLAIQGYCASNFHLVKGFHGKYCCPGNTNEGTCSDDAVAGPCGNNGSCPNGYKCDSNRYKCCPAEEQSVSCSEKFALGPCVLGTCPNNFQCDTKNGWCCGTKKQSVDCDAEISLGACDNGECTFLGYQCNSNQTACCPTVNYKDPSNILGPAYNFTCPGGYTIVFIPGMNVDKNGQNTGTCVSL